MRVCGKGAVLIGTEGSSPPLPYLTVDDNQGATFVRLGIAVEVSDDVAAPVEPVVEPVVEAPVEPVVEPVVEAPVVETKEETREEAISAALDLVEEDGLVKTGARAGKPKVSAIEAITGLNDVTVEEIDAALAAREAA
jgi:hypothetical protein